MHKIIQSAICMLLFSFVFVATTGCSKVELISTEYGVISGNNGSASVNGTSVLYDMFRERGFGVKKRKRISPRIESYETIVWIPNDHDCPSVEAIEALGEWLNGGYTRRLIYVGRDYECQAEYLRKVLEDTPLDQKEETLRQIAEAKLKQDVSHERFNRWSPDEVRDSCEWFEQKRLERKKVTKLSGPMAKGVDAIKSGLETSTILVPKDYSGETFSHDINPLLDADDEPFAFEVYDKDYGYQGSVIVVSNGSFLLNYALINDENRKLAGRLIDEVDEYGDVLFLESGPRGIGISDTDVVNHNNWAWIAEAPLRYIVPHFLLWGILFCFVCYPIFGRPRKLELEDQSTFRSHVNATGKLIARSKLPNRAANRIEKYHEHTDNAHRLKKKE